MRKMKLEFQLPVSIFKENKYFIAYTPVLDLSTSAESFEGVKIRFGEVVKIFFEELNEKGTTDGVLSNLGWKKVQKQWSPPKLIAHEEEKFSVPFPA